MNEPDAINSEAARIYLDGARNALRGARYNLDGDFYGVAVNRAYYAFFYAATALGGFHTRDPLMWPAS